MVDELVPLFIGDIVFFRRAKRRADHLVFHDVFGQIGSYGFLGESS